MEDKKVFIWALIILAVAFLYSNFIDGKTNITGFAVKEKVDITCTFKGYPVGTNDAYETLSSSFKNDCYTKDSLNNYITCIGNGGSCTLSNYKIERGTYKFWASSCKSEPITVEIKANTKKIEIPFYKCGDLKERVTCNFLNGDSTNKCYYRTSASKLGDCTNNGGNCSLILNGKDTVLRYPEILWTGCGSYSYTKLDGSNEQISLNCNKWKAKCVDKEFRLSSTSITGAYLNVEKCDNGSWTNYTSTNYSTGITNISELKNSTLYLLNGSQILELCANNQKKSDCNCSNNTYTNITSKNITLTPIQGSAYIENNTNNIKTGETFFLNNQNTGNLSFTYLVRYDSIDPANVQLRINDLSGGSRQFTYMTTNTDGYYGKASLVFGGYTYTTWIDYKNGDYTLLVDLDKSGSIDNYSVVNITLFGAKTYNALEVFSNINKYPEIITNDSIYYYINFTSREGKNFYLKSEKTKNIEEKNPYCF